MHAPLTTLRTADFLATVPLFRQLDPAELRGFAELTREQRYAKNAVIVSEGDPGDALYLVRHGSVKVVLIGEDGREVILGQLGIGEHFGELSLIDEQPRSAHVIAVENSILLVLRRADFRRRVETNPKVAWALLAELSRRLRQADGTIGSLVLLDVPGRVARLLLERANDEEPAVVAGPLTHQTIAQMVGASRETVSRIISDLQEAGTITVEKRQIRIVDRGALSKRAQLRG
jgi:CRP-like cAMP-binding protein